MATERVDAETLSALLDGTLTTEQRADVLARIARSDVACQALAEVSALLAELNAGSRETPEPAPSEATRPVAGSADSADHAPERRTDPRDFGLLRAVGSTGRQQARRWLLVTFAAVAAAIVIVISARDRSSGLDVLDRVAADDASASIVLASAVERATASASRGGGPASLIVEADAFRLGVEAVDFELALRAGDTAITRAIAGSITRLLRDVTGGQPVLLRAERLAGEPNPSGVPPRQLSREMRSLLHGKEHWFDLGAWVQSARLAAHSEDLGFFAPSGDAMRQLSRVLGSIDAASPSAGWPGASPLERMREFRTVSVTRASLPSAAAALDSVVIAATR